MKRDSKGDLTVRRLVLKYCAEMRDQGRWNARSHEVNSSRLWSFAQDCCEDPMRVNRRHVAKWLARPNLSAGYRRSRFSTLRGFCGWCVVNGYMKADPTFGHKTPTVPAALPRALTVAQVAKVLAACPDERTRLIVTLMAQEGLRRAEVCGLQAADVDLANQSIAVRGKGGGGAITRVLPLSDESVRAAEDYLRAYPASYGPFVRSYKHPDRGLTPHTLGDLVANVMEAAGVHVAGDGRTAHALRHSMAHHMIDQGADVLEVKAALGHATVRTTEVYLRGRVEDLRTAMGGRKYRGATEERV